MPARLELVELRDEDAGIDDATGADRAALARDDAGRDLPDLVRLLADDDRVAGVRAALVAADEVGVLREQVDDLSLPLVAPLRADDHGGWHARQSCTCDYRTAASSGSSTGFVSTAETAGRPDAAQGLSAPARSPTITSGGAAESTQPAEERQRRGRGEATDDERRADAARLAERAESKLPADAAGTRDHRVEGDDGGALLRRHDLMEIRRPNGTGDTRATP